MSHSDHGIIKDKQAQEQPTDKRRARTRITRKPAHRRREKRRVIPGSTTPR